MLFYKLVLDSADEEQLFRYFKGSKSLRSSKNKYTIFANNNILYKTLI